MEKRRALGKGLQALIPDVRNDTVDTVNTSELGENEAILHLNTSDIKSGRYQPRTDFNQQKLQELISSIKEQGVVQPILVRKTDSGYEIIAGERRLRAVKSLGIDKIPAIVREVDDVNAMEIGLIENIQREDLNVIEEAKAYSRLTKEFHYTHEQIAQAVGKDRTSVTNALRMLNLPMKIQQLILEDIITMGHARALLSVADPHSQMTMCEKIIKKGLSVREAEQLVKPHTAKRKAPGYESQDPHLRAAEDDLQKTLGTRVKIYHGRKRGKVVIEYFSTDDLDRIIGIIKR